MRPSELGICTQSEDSAYMIAFAMTRKMMEAYEEEVTRRDIAKAEAETEAKNRYRSR